jgi:G:T-mismatch repair DNA endonuclease (very short patch repair protein)
VNVVIEGGAAERLEAMKEQTGAADLTEVLRTACAVAMHGCWWSRPSDINATNEKSGKSRWFDVCRSDVRVTKVARIVEI